MDQDPTPSAPEDLCTEIALFRHALVAPLADGELERGELTMELRKLARRRHRIPGSRRRRVGLSTLRRWLALYRRGGLEALKPGLRSDYGRSRAIPEEWVVKAMQLRRDLPSRSTRVLVEMLERLEGYPGINVHTLDMVLRRRGMPRQPRTSPPKEQKGRKKRWVAEHVNAIWQGDATPGVWIPDPRDPSGKRMALTVLFLWLDDASRLVPYAQFFLDQKLPRMERTLKLALLRRGVPGAAYTDHGNVYRAVQFLAALAELGIRPIKSRRYYPGGRGKIERIFGVIQDDLYPEIVKEVRAGNLRTLAQLNEVLWAWLERVYHLRVHSELGRTPLDAYQAGLAHVRPAEAVKVARAFLWRYTRLVSKNGFLSLLGNTYSVDPAWSSQKLELRLDPFDLSQVDVYRDRRPVARARVVELQRSTVPGLDLEPLAPPPALEPSGVSFLDLLRQEYHRQQAAELGEISFRDALAGRPSHNQEESEQ